MSGVVEPCRSAGQIECSDQQFRVKGVYGQSIGIGLRPGRQVRQRIQPRHLAPDGGQEEPRGHGGDRIAGFEGSRNVRLQFSRIQHRLNDRSQIQKHTLLDVAPDGQPVQDHHIRTVSGQQLRIERPNCVVARDGGALGQAHSKINDDVRVCLLELVDVLTQRLTVIKRIHAQEIVRLGGHVFIEAIRNQRQAAALKICDDRVILRVEQQRPRLDVGLACRHQLAIRDLNQHRAACVRLVQSVRANIVECAIRVIADHTVVGFSRQRYHAQGLSGFDIENGDQAVARRTDGDLVAMHGHRRPAGNGVLLQSGAFRRKAIDFNIAQAEQLA